MSREFESVDDMLRAVMRGRHALVVMREAAQRRRGRQLASGDPAKRQDAMIAALSITRIDRLLMDIDVVHGDLRLRDMLRADAKASEDQRHDLRDVNDGTPPAA